jgi:signal transduction histidine kinase
MGPFYIVQAVIAAQHHPDTTPRGLGLYITKSLVELHNGDIAISSHVDIGTKVVLTFPNERVL